MDESDLRGFWYHYKHDPDGPVSGYAYEFLNIARHTEIAEATEGMLLVYRPLYRAGASEDGKRWFARPLAMVLEPVDTPAYKGPRFAKIKDKKVIAKLEKIRDEMYGGRI